MIKKKQHRRHWGRIILRTILWTVGFAVLVIFIISAVLNSTWYIEQRFALPPDEVPPVVTLNGTSEMVVAVGSNYEDPGVDAYDLRGEVEITVEGEVNTTKIGEYDLTYVVTDESSNATRVGRKVKVIAPTGRIYLTFDDGPGLYTESLLDVLKKYGVKATFFVTGRGDDGIIKREHDEGHTVGLHTFSHDYSYVYSSVDNYFADLNQVAERVKNVTGQDTRLIRFPGGSSNTISARYDRRVHIMSRLVDEVARRGYVYFDWNVNSGDADKAKTADDVYNNIVSTLKVGGDSVILQHDIKDFSVAAVERIIQYGLENGFVFEKLNDKSFTAHHNVNN